MSEFTFSAFEALFIFSLTYLSIVWGKISHTICALVGGSSMILSGIVTQDMAIHSFIDFNTIGLLFGMMILISIVKDTGFFDAVSLFAIKLSKGNPRKLLILLSFTTGIGAAILDSVTIALLIAPMTLSICDKLKMNPLPILIAEILLANIGGTALMIGNPPNVMIGSAAKLSFNSFLYNLAPIVLLNMLLIIGILLLIFKKELKLPNPEINFMDNIDYKTVIKDPKRMKHSLAILLLTIIGFICHHSLHLQSATIALSGAILAMLFCSTNPKEALKQVDLDTLLFFMGLFILVGGLENTGIIKRIASFSLELVKGDTKVLSIVILFLSGIASAFVDNIPFTATMIPLVQNIQSIIGNNAQHLWWALALGACFGGNGTLIGASPNVIIISAAHKNGYDLSFKRFFIICFPLMLLTLFTSFIYIYLRYL